MGTLKKNTDSTTNIADSWTFGIENLSAWDGWRCFTQVQLGTHWLAILTRCFSRALQVLAVPFGHGKT